MRREGGEMLSASEIGDYAFCGKAWSLKRSGVRPSANASARRSGAEYHRAHGAGVRRVARVESAGRFVGRAAMVGIVVALAVWLVCA